MTDAEIRAALEAVLGESFNGTPVSRVGRSVNAAHGPFLRTLLVRTSTKKVNTACSRAVGGFCVFCVVPRGDGIEAAEALAGAIIAQFMPHDRLLGGLVRVVDAWVTSDNFDPDDWARRGHLLVACALIDWQVDQIG